MIQRNSLDERKYGMIALVHLYRAAHVITETKIKLKDWRIIYSCSVVIDFYNEVLN